eukprot:7388238-Prymnesium_polylepis.1
MVLRSTQGEPRAAGQSFGFLQFYNAAPAKSEALVSHDCFRAAFGDDRINLTAIVLPVGYLRCRYAQHGTLPQDSGRARLAVRHHSTRRRRHLCQPAGRALAGRAPALHARGGEGADGAFRPPQRRAHRLAGRGGLLRGRQRDFGAGVQASRWLPGLRRQLHRLPQVAGRAKPQAAQPASPDHPLTAGALSLVASLGPRDRATGHRSLLRLLGEADEFTRRRQHARAGGVQSRAPRELHAITWPDSGAAAMEV